MAEQQQATASPVTPTVRALRHTAIANLPRDDKRYRCYLNRVNAVAETGEREFVQLKAPSAALAARRALAVTGAAAVVEVERLEEEAA